LLDSNNALLELLPDVVFSVVVLHVRENDLLGLDLTDLLWLQKDVVVSATLVYHFNVRLFMSDNVVSDLRIVSVLTLLLDFPVNVWIFWENLAHEELL